MEKKAIRVLWSAVVLGVPVLAILANWDKVKAWAETQPPLEQGRNSPVATKTDHCRKVGVHRIRQ